MELSSNVKERFCKDCNIPLKLFQEPYFTDRLKLYDPYYNTLKKWELFIKELAGYHCEQDYFEEYNRVKDTAIREIQAAEGYKNFNAEDMNQYRVTHNNLPGKDIFKTSNDGKCFVSLDMVKANFSALRHYDSSIFHYEDTWESFIGRYTQNQHMIRSKYIRQVILGNCNPKRHITYEKYLMDMILTLLEEKGLPLEKVVFFSNDEIVIEIPDLEREFLTTLTEQAAPQMPVPFRVELFTLHKIKGTDGYYKEISQKDQAPKIDFKCLDNYMLPFVLRHFLGEEITENDKVFCYEGRLAKFIEIPVL